MAVKQIYVLEGIFDDEREVIKTSTNLERLKEFAEKAVECGGYRYTAIYPMIYDTAFEQVYTDYDRCVADWGYKYDLVSEPWDV